MSELLRPLLVRLLMAMGVLAVLAGAWSFVAPRYNDAVSGVANVFGPSSVRVDGEGTRWAITYFTGATRPPSARLNSLTLHAGLVLMLALTVVTPRLRLPWRAGWTLAVFFGFLLFHGLTLALLAWAFRWEIEQRGLVTLTGLMPSVPLTYVALPALVGGVWCWRMWWPHLAPTLASAGRGGRMTRARGRAKS